MKDETLRLEVKYEDRRRYDGTVNSRLKSSDLSHVGHVKVKRLAKVSHLRNGA